MHQGCYDSGSYETTNLASNYRTPVRSLAHSFTHSYTLTLLYSDRPAMLNVIEISQSPRVQLDLNTANHEIIPANDHLRVSYMYTQLTN